MVSEVGGLDEVMLRVLLFVALRERRTVSDKESPMVKAFPLTRMEDEDCLSLKLRTAE